MFVQHTRYKEAVLRKSGTFTAQCLEKPADPGIIRDIPHSIKFITEEYSQPITVYTLGLTLTPKFCFVKRLSFRCNSQFRPTEADKYLFLDMVLDYLQTDFIALYKKEKLAISSEADHFAEMAIKKGFRLHLRTLGQTHRGWRAIKCLENS